MAALHDMKAMLFTWLSWSDLRNEMRIDVRQGEIMSDSSTAFKGRETIGNGHIW
jgi:hypothetical protein